MRNFHPRLWPRLVVTPLQVVLFVFIPCRLFAAPVPLGADLMPVPREVQMRNGRLPVTAQFSVKIVGAGDDTRLREAVSRTLQDWENRAGLKFAPAAEPPASLVITCDSTGSKVVALGENESYELEVTERQATLHAATVVGALRGVTTLSQLFHHAGSESFLLTAMIRDEPRFPWRGLLIDVARHWEPMGVIKRQLDGMALVKLNVLHLHLTEDQGFRIESKSLPELQEKGSDDHYFKQSEMREIVAYANARGIRVVPEFDMPGHATSWVVSHPELASLPGPYAVERRWGVFDPVFDPSNEALYTLLEKFLGEMADVFPDPYVHIGGDENNHVQWNANPRIQAFIQEHHLKGNEGLQTYFNRRVSAILAAHGKKLIGWDEILQAELPAGSVIHSWRGPAGLADAVRLGFPCILSFGYYIDLLYPASDHYLNDPLPADTRLTPDEQRRVLGGEATMWGESVTPETIDSRIWPRTAAIAERLWSPREINDVADMYRRLAVMGARLSEAGLQHDSNREMMLRRLAGETLTLSELQDLRILVDVIEPVKDLRRFQQLQPLNNQMTPMDGLADCARPDSTSAREFATAVDQFLFSSRDLDPVLAKNLAQQLQAWQAAGQHVAGDLAAKSARLHEAVSVAGALAEVSGVGAECLQRLLSHDIPSEDWVRTRSAILYRAAQPDPSAVELPILASLRLLLAGTAQQAQRGALSNETWRQYLHAIAPPAEKTPSP